MIGRVVIERQNLPDWFFENYPAQIPLPANNFDELKGEVIACGMLGERKIPLLSRKRRIRSNLYPM